MIIETAPAPLMVYQRRVSVTGYEPPETATPELDEELTDPEDDCRLLDDDELDVDALDADDVVAVLAVSVDEDDVVPGMVTAPTVPKMATPATAAKAMPAVSRSSRERALSRAWIRASGDIVLGMLVRMRPASQSSL